MLRIRAKLEDGNFSVGKNQVLSECLPSVSPEGTFKKHSLASGASYVYSMGYVTVAHWDKKLLFIQKLAFVKCEFCKKK